MKEGFYAKVGEIWKNENRGENSLQKWQNKIRCTRQYLRGWSKNIRWNEKKEMKVISTFSPSEQDTLCCLKDIISYLLREEEIAWFQGLKTKNLLEGDNNTKYFFLQMVGIGRHAYSNWKVITQS